MPHNYIITSVELVRRSDLDNRVLVLTTSVDYSVALWDVYGNHIGVFGQVRNMGTQMRQQ